MGFTFCIDPTSNTIQPQRNRVHFAHDLFIIGYLWYLVAYGPPLSTVLLFVGATVTIACLLSTFQALLYGYSLGSFITVYFAHTRVTESLLVALVAIVFISGALLALGPSPAALIPLFGMCFMQQCIFGSLFILHLWRIFALLQRYVLVIIGCIESSQSTSVCRYIISIGFIISCVELLICGITCTPFGVRWIICHIIKWICISATIVWHINWHQLRSSLGLSVTFGATLAAFVALYLTYLTLSLPACGDGFYFDAFITHIRTSHIRTSTNAQCIADQRLSGSTCCLEQRNYIKVITEESAFGHARLLCFALPYVVLLYCLIYTFSFVICCVICNGLSLIFIFLCHFAIFNACIWSEFELERELSIFISMA